MLDHMHAVSGPANVYCQARHTINGARETVQGTLHLSRKGYLYAEGSKVVTWLKFAGLSLYTPMLAMIAKVGQLLSGEAHPYSDLGHMMRLAWVALKASLGVGNKSLQERVEEFGLAELAYHGQPLQELRRPRSERFSEGGYVAMCMQPLFHKSHHTPLAPLQERIARERDPERLAELRELYDLTKRCEKYAKQALMKGDCKKNFQNRYVETEEVECCEVPLYRQRRVCGFLHTIECCFMRCFALECCSHAFCISPDLGCCLIT